MGKKLSKEVEIFIQNQKIDNFELSFVGFSLGGVIIRACLPFLVKY